jgi:serine/threonine protein kinase
MNVKSCYTTSPFQPENIMISEAGLEQIKLVDFGLSRRILRNQQVYAEIGSPEFVAPEVVNNLPVSTAADIWSVGVLTYVL